MRRLLLVSFYFPPNGGAGAQRPAKLAKYLPQFGWNVTVVAPDPSIVNSVWAPVDASMNADVGNVEVVRVGRRGNPSSWKPIVDRSQGWVVSAYEQISKLLRTGRFDAVAITMSPFSLAHLAVEIRRTCEIPLILDFRDPWALDGWYRYRHRIAWLRDLNLMKRAILAADGVVANTNEALLEMQRLVPSTPGDRWTVVPNGFDSDDFLGDVRKSIPGIPDRKADEIRLVHIGTLHSSRLYPNSRITARLKRAFQYSPEPIEPGGRTLVYLLKAMRKMRDEGAKYIHKTRLVCVGTDDAATRRCVQDSGMSDQVFLSGYVSHRDSLSVLRSTDALFLPLHGYRDRKRPSRIVPGKTYEYLATGKPILGCLPAGDARNLIEKSGVGYLAYPTDTSEIRSAVHHLLDDIANQRRINPTAPDWVKAFDRRALAGRFADFVSNAASVR